MTKTIIVGGYGPGISNAVAERFGKEGFTAAIVGRNAERLAAGKKSLEAKGVKAEAFPADLGKPDEVKALVAKVREKLGPVTVLHWNAYATAAGDFTTCGTEELAELFTLPIVSLVAGIQAALPDLRAQKGGVLITNGGLGFHDPGADAAAVGWNVMGLAVANAAKRKLVGLLAHKLKDEGVFVGEVVVTGVVKGTSFDQGNGTIEASAIASKFWDIYNARTETSVTI